MPRQLKADGVAGPVGHPLQTLALLHESVLSSSATESVLHNTVSALIFSEAGRWAKLGDVAWMMAHEVLSLGSVHLC